MDGELLIRPFQIDDADQLYSIISNPIVVKDMLQLPSMEITETLSWARRTEPGRHRLVAQKGDRVIGSINVTHNQRPRLMHSGKIGLMVDPPFWGQGVGRRLMEAALQLADGWLDLKRLELGVYSDNVRAIKLYEGAGFQVEGRRRCATFGPGAWRDELLMARLRGIENLRPAPELQGPSDQQAAERLPAPEQLTIRPPRPEDYQGVYEIMSDPAVCRTTLQMPSQEVTIAQGRLAEPTPGIYRFVADTGEKVIGIMALHQDRKPRQAHSAGLGMSVHPQYWGRHVGTRLMEAMIDLADNWLNLKRIELDVNVDNPAGVHLYEKFGFEVEGTRRFHAYGDGRWTDSYFMARIRS